MVALSSAMSIVAGVGGAVLLVVTYRKQQRAEAGYFLERLSASSSLLGDTNPTVQVAGIYALAALADESKGTRRQQCIDVMCGYLRLPYFPEAGASLRPTTTKVTTTSNQEGGGSRLLEESFEHRPSDGQIRETVLDVIRTHLQHGADEPWHANDFNFRGATFDGGSFSGAVFRGRADFTGARFVGGRMDFRHVEFSEGNVSFAAAEFSGGTVDFWKAKFEGSSVRFVGAKIRGGRLDFRYAEFGDGTVDFTGTDFSGGAVLFDGAKFMGAIVRFRLANFLNGSTVRFGLTEFSGGEVSFDAAKFKGGEVAFNLSSPRPGGRTHIWGGAKFQGAKVSFFSSEFLGTAVSFARATFTGGEVSFESPRSWDVPPIVDWNGTPPEAIRPQDWPPKGPRADVSRMLGLQVPARELDGH